MMTVLEKAKRELDQAVEDVVAGDWRYHNILGVRFDELEKLTAVWQEKRMTWREAVKQFPYEYLEMQRNQ